MQFNMSPRLGRCRRALGIAAMAAITLVMTWLQPPVASAGQPCDPQPLTARDVRNGINLAAQTAEELARQQVHVGVIARVGQDLSRWGQQYSHIGIVYQTNPPGAKPTWRIVHKLNNCGTNEAHLYRQGLVEFFTDTPYKWETVIVPLAPGVADKVLRDARNNVRLRRLHEPMYSMVAYPWATRYQQSNQWVTETLAGALAPQVGNRHQAQQWLRFQGYVPDPIRIGTFKRLGARITRANVEFDDHPMRRRVRGRIETTTADSVLRWLQVSRLGTSSIVVRLDPFRRYGGQTTNRSATPAHHARPPARRNEAEDFWQ